MSGLSEVRNVVAEEPSVEALLALVDMFRHWDGPEDEKGVAVSYVNSHLKGWPYRFRVLFDEHEVREWVEVLFPVSQEDALIRAEEAVQRQSLPGVLDASIGGWQSTKHPAWAELAVLAEARMPVITLKGKKDEKYTQWCALVEQKDLLMVSRLWEASFSRSFRDMSQRFESLKSWSYDPRAVSVLMKWLREIPWTSNAAQTFWRAIFSYLKELDDPRLSEITSYPELWDVRPVMHEWMQKQLDKSVPAMTLSTPEALSGDDVKRLDNIKQVLGELSLVEEPEERSAVEGELEEAWRALSLSPQSDERRAALATLLEEQGDVRGEFIRLQLQKKLTKSERARLKELRTAFAKEWLGPLQTCVLGAPVYKRGFLTKLKVNISSASAAKEIRDSFLWSTVEEIEFSTSQKAKWQPITEMFRSVRVLKQLNADGVSSLSALNAPLPLEQLSLPAGAFAELSQTTNFPHVSKLTLLFSPRLQVHELVEELIGAAFSSQLTFVRIEFFDFMNLCQATKLLEHLPALERLELARETTTVALNKAKRGWSIGVTARQAIYVPGWRPFVDGLRLVNDLNVTDVTFTWLPFRPEMVKTAEMWEVLLEHLGLEEGAIQGLPR